MSAEDLRLRFEALLDRYTSFDDLEPYQQRGLLDALVEIAVSGEGRETQ